MNNENKHCDLPICVHPIGRIQKDAVRKIEPLPEYGIPVKEQNTFGCIVGLMENQMTLWNKVNEIIEKLNKN